MTDGEVLHQIDQLQMSYAAALDRRDMNRWIDCFSSQGSYICTTLENESEGFPVALMMDDCHARLVDRVKFVTEVWADTFEDYLTRHFVQRLEWLHERDGAYSVVSNFMVAYTTTSGRSEILASGCYLDRVERQGDGLLFRSKKAVLDAAITPRYLVYPI